MLTATYFTDEDNILEPVWLSQPRGFVDAKQLRIARLESFLDTFSAFPAKNWAWSETQWTLGLGDVSVELTLDDSFRASSIKADSDTMPRRFLDPLRSDLRTLVSAMLNTRYNEWTLVVLFQQLVEIVTDYTITWKPDYDPDTLTDWAPDEGWSNDGDQVWDSMFLNNAGVDLGTVEDVALHLLHKPIADICADLPDWLRILHVEPVFRNNLVSRFLEKQQEVLADLQSIPYNVLRAAVSNKDVPRRSVEDRQLGLAEFLSEPTVTFHGAPRNVMASIVRHGFVLPGTRLKGGDLVDVRCGSTYGRGIYSSPDLVYAANYTTYSSGTYNPTATPPAQVPGMRLVVCATLRGLPRRATYYTTEEEEELGEGPGYSHSRFSPNKCEYIVFEPAQIIPCYVLHLDFGAEEARKHFGKLPDDPQEFVRATAKQERRAKQAAQEEEQQLWPGLVKDKQKQRQRAAEKWFPYGFGPATGTRFVIEEIAEVSDDEEVYGDYQRERAGEENEAWADEGMSKKGAGWFDEYQLVRRAK